MVGIERIEGLCERGLATVGYDLVDWEFVRDQHGWVLRVFIDHPPAADEPGDPLAGSSISHEDCQRASDQISTLLDVEDPIDVAYRLEVSSPGIPRPVRKERDFKRFCGCFVRVQMREPIGGRKNFAGTLREVDSASQVVVEIDGQLYALPIAGIRRAHVGEI
ncbi:MAG: ribosome maturation factor RimP [Deltaproteobacteria bacterium]|nr:ribosome maturation factor RimP [Deltaproteobacteria bacterium]